MPLSMHADYHDVPPTCVLELPAKQRPADGECIHDGKPHGKDWVKVKPKLSYGEKLDLAQHMQQSAAAGLCWLIERLVVEWSLTDRTYRLVNPIEDAKGEPLPITAAVIYDLDEETADFLTSLSEQEQPAEGDGEGPKGSAKRSRRR